MRFFVTGISGFAGVSLAAHLIDRGHLVASSSLEELSGRGQTLEDAYLQLTTEPAS